LEHEGDIRHVSLLRRGGRWLRGVGGPAWYVPFVLTLVLTPVGLHDYLLFHTLVEVFAVVIAVMATAVAWNTYAFSRNDFLMFLGVGYFWVGILHLFHTLLYKGMGVFPAYGADAATQLWLLGCFMESAVLLVAPLYLERRVAAGRLFWALGAVTLMAGLAVATGRFPHAYVEGVGLTRFKLDSEYLIITLFVLAWLHLWHRRARVDRRLLTLLRMSILFSVFAEVAFTFYANVYGPANLVGHLLKLFAVWWIYTALVESSLSRPFAAMARGANSYDAVPDPTLVVDRGGAVRRTNRALREELALDDAGIIGRDSHLLLHPPGLAREQCPVCTHVAAGDAVHGLEVAFPGGHCYEFTLSPITWAEGEPAGTVCVRRDITRRKVAESSLLRIDPRRGGGAAAARDLRHSRQDWWLPARMGRFCPGGDGTAYRGDGGGRRGQGAAGDDGGQLGRGGYRAGRRGGA